MVSGKGKNEGLGGFGGEGASKQTNKRIERSKFGDVIDGR